MFRFRLFVVLACQLLISQQLLAQTREEKVRNDRERVESEGFWIYNDLPQAFQTAKQTGKPILVVLRCIPCEECVKLDDDLVEQDPVIRPLLDEFVCARQVSTNGLDLDLFQFDTDQSFAVFFLNADGTIYGRFGTRSHRTEWLGDVSLQGLAAAMQGALKLHQDYPSNKQALAGKRGAPLEFPSPEDYPKLKEKYTDSLNYEGNVVQSCIHCHQIGDSRREFYRASEKPIPENILNPYPHPLIVGLVLDPHTAATVKEVTDGSVADAAGIKAGDEITKLNGQPILSMADVQWVLDQTSPSGDTVTATVNRNGKMKELAIKVEDGWKRQSDLSWRSSTWGLRRMATGGLLVRELPVEERQGLDIDENSMALEVKHVGQYNEHAAAKRAGFQVGDIIVALDGRTDFHSEDDLLRYGVTEKKPGEFIAATVMRDGRRINLRLPMQE